MSFRINTNTQSAFSLTALNKTSNEIGMRQMRLATGSKINNAGDDSAGFTISNKLQATTRGQAQALSNIGDAKSMLSVAEGSLGSTMDILQTMKEKAVQAGNSSMGTEERAAIQTQVDALAAEVSDILGGANFNGTQLFSDDAATSLSFQVGDKSGDTFGATVSQLGVETLGIATVGVAAADATATISSQLPSDAVSIADPSAYTGTDDFTYNFTVLDSPTTPGQFVVEYQDRNGDTQRASNDHAFDVDPVFPVDGLMIRIDVDNGYSPSDGDTFSIAAQAPTDADPEAVTSSLDLTDDAGVATALTTIDAAISSVNQTASSLGDVQNRLDFKAQNLETSMNNYDAARSRIADADFAKEQMEVVKLQILQQTGSAMFAQANAAPQSVLSFF